MQKKYEKYELCRNEMKKIWTFILQLEIIYIDKHQLIKPTFHILEFINFYVSF